MAEEGDKGIVFSVDSPFSSFVEVPPAVVGDKVILYPLHSGDKLAVPSLDLELNGAVWVSPEWKDPVFDWQIPFIFDLIPLDLGPGYYTIRHLTDAYIIDDVKGAWTIDALIGKYVHIIAGTNAGNYYLITDNGDNWIGVRRTPISMDNSLANWYYHPDYFQGPDYSYTDGIFTFRSDTTHYYQSVPMAWWGIINPVPWGTTVTCYIKYNSGYSTPYDSELVWGSEYSSYSGPWLNLPMDDQWYLYTFVVGAPWSYPPPRTSQIGFSLPTGNIMGTEFGPWKTISIRDISSNGYATLPAMGFAVGNLFEIVDSIP